MIVRFPIKCLTCEKPHTVRIGMGQEEHQNHRFHCRGCDEFIELRMEVNYKELSHRVVCIENCEPIAEVLGAPIVNVDANFLIPEEQQGVDRVFPRLNQMQQIFSSAEKAGSLVNLSKLSDEQIKSRPFRRPDYAGEWELLKRAWSLARNDQLKLSKKKILEASSTLYPNDPLKNLQDWIWRHALFSCQPGYEADFQNAMRMIEKLGESIFIPEFAKMYDSILAERGSKYFDLMKEFYSSFSEFGQVFFSVVRKINLPTDHIATSSNFDAVKMFYGNAYEHFTSLVEVLALLNNMLSGRGHDKFQKLTLEGYRALDKSSRFGPFAMNAPFVAICSEADNQIRNASHHGSFVFEPKLQIINYRSGKGGTGPLMSMSYVSYLERCVKIYLQTMTLLRIDLILSLNLRIRPPV